MKINELRLDNTVNVKGSKEPRDVTVEDFRLAIDGENPYLTPVKLTAEWLLKFGFLHLGIGLISEDNLLFVYCEKDGKYEIFLYQSKQEDAYLAHFEFVHQLQNLYFALTGKELTLK